MAFCRELSGIKVFIEQSLSDFGDADAILLLDVGDSKGVVFLEAKVKSSQRKEWKLEWEFEKFKAGSKTTGKLSSSNLFTQLYHKYQFIEGLKSPDIGIKGLQENGMKCAACSTKASRKIGYNRVVLDAAKAIEPYGENAWYIGLVPDHPNAIRDFYRNFREHNEWPLTPAHLDKSRWGGLAWEQVGAFCEKSGLATTKQVLSFNREQIY